MKLSDLRPCANCGDPLFGERVASAYMLKASQILIDAKAANETLGLARYFQGNMKLAELFSPGNDREVMIFADAGGSWETLFLCFGCAAGLSNVKRPILEMLEMARNTQRSK